MLLTEYNEEETKALFWREGFEEGFEEGLEEGEERFGLLIFKLMSADRLEDVKKAIVNKDERKRLYAEYGIVQRERRH